LNRFLVFLALLGLGTACTSARIQDRESDALFQKGQYAEAAARFEAGWKKNEGKNDELLFLLDWGLSLHQAGDYAGSIKVFLLADRIADIQDYTSLGKVTESLLLSENSMQYKGEDFEKVLINAYLAINFALVGKTEDALVEARRVNSKIYRMINEGGRKYEESAFARYLSAVLYEKNRDWNDAYVDYKKTRALVPQFPGLGRDLWRMARILGIREDQDRWVKEYSLTEADLAETKKLMPKSGFGEIVVIYQNGISPEKRPSPAWYRIPKFFPRHNPVSHAEVWVNGEKRADTAVLQNIEAVAIQNLDDRMAGIIAKRVAGYVAKEVVADQVENQFEKDGKATTGSVLAGFFTRMALHASDQPDLRSWKLLPRDLQMARVTVEPGKYTVDVRPVGYSGAGVPRPQEVEVKAGEKVIVNARYMPQ
jgi:uncharacterized protein